MKNGVGHNKGRGSKDNKYLMLNWFRVSYQFCLLWSAAQRLPNEIEMLKITKSIKNEHTHTLNTESPGQPKRKPTQRDAEATLSTLQRLEDKSVRCTQLSHATSSLGPGRASGANLITSHNVREHSLSLALLTVEPPATVGLPHGLGSRNLDPHAHTQFTSQSYCFNRFPHAVSSPIFRDPDSNRIFSSVLCKSRRSLVIISRKHC